MSDVAYHPCDVAPFGRGRLSRRHSSWTVAGAGAVTVAVLVGSWTYDHRAHRAPAADLGTARLTAAFHTPPAPALPDLPRPAAAASVPSPTLAAADQPTIDPAADRGPSTASTVEVSAPPRLAAIPPVPAAGSEPAAPGPAIALIAPLPEAHDEAPAAPLPPASAVAAAEPKPQVETVPLPTPRPALAWAAPEPARAARRALARNTDTAPTPAAPGSPAATSDNRGFLERFFNAFKPSDGPALAYASPEDGLFGRSGLPGGPATPHDRFTAVYDISAHTVYLPDGTRLEAHSGLGGMLDDPRHVTARNTGPTPPHLYDLSLRESLFHGVQALRLNPVGGGGVYGRSGLLAHTYMLGPNGQSNGCVSFRDYQAFLRAYQNGQVRRLVVVAGGAG